MDKIKHILSLIEHLEGQTNSIQEKIKELRNEVKQLSSLSVEEHEVAKGKNRIINEILALVAEVKIKTDYGYKVPSNSFTPEALVEEVAIFEDTVGDVGNQFSSRTDAYENQHFDELMDYVQSILDEQYPSRFQLDSPKEASVSTQTVEKINRGRARQQEARDFYKKPYVGRIDFYNVESNEPETFYIGDKAFSNDDQDLLVIRWSHDKANIFYDKRIGQVVEYEGLGKVKLDYTRKMDTGDGKIFLHDPLTSGLEEDDKALIMKLENNKGVLNEMELITMTIGRAQNKLIRSPLNEIMIIQGSAGSGKSIIALYRISYLLDKSKENHKDGIKLGEDTVAFFGPNNLFLQHIDSALKGLGNEAIIKDTLLTYLKKIMFQKVKSADIPKIGEPTTMQVDNVKGKLDYKEFIEAVTLHSIQNIAPFIDNLKVLVDNKSYEIPGVDVASTYELSQNLNYVDRKNWVANKLEQYLSATIKRENDFEKSIFKSINNYIEQKITDELALTLDKSSLQSLRDIVSEKTLQAIKQAADTIKRENRKENANTFLASAETMAARNLMFQSNLLLNQDLEHYFTENQERIHTLLLNQFDAWVATAYKEMIDELIKHRENNYVKNRVTQYIRSLELPYAQSLKEILGDSSIQEIEEIALVEFNGLREKFYKQYIEFIVKQTKGSLYNHFKYVFEKQVKSIIEGYYTQVYMIKINLAQYYQFALPTITKQSDDEKFKALAKKNHLIQQVNDFLHPKFYESHITLYQEILKDKHQLMEQYLKEKPISMLRSDKTSLQSDDILGLFHVYLILQGTSFTRPLLYTVVDEAQDLNPYSIWAIRQISRTDGIMLFGDLGQNINKSNQFDTWAYYAELLGNVTYYNLEANYRSTKPIMDYCNTIIDDYAKGKYKLPSKAYRSGEPVKTIEIKEFDFNDTILQEVEYATEKSYQTVAIICRDYNELTRIRRLLHGAPKFAILGDHLEPEMKYIITTVEKSKGLQFDHVIIPNRNSYQDKDFDKKLLYVAASRALHNLLVIELK